VHSPITKLPRLSKSLGLIVILAFVVSGCGAIVPVEAADDANDPLCAEVIIRLPQTVDGQSKRETNAQATGAWGVPASVILRCGIEPTGPTALPCVNLNGIDWIRDDSLAPIYRFEAYGREPGLEVIVDAEAETPISGTNVLIDLQGAVSQLPQTRQCISLSETYDFSE